MSDNQANTGSIKERIIVDADIHTLIDSQGKNMSLTLSEQADLKTVGPLAVSDQFEDRHIGLSQSDMPQGESSDTTKLLKILGYTSMESFIRDVVPTSIYDDKVTPANLHTLRFGRPLQVIHRNAVAVGQTRLFLITCYVQEDAPAHHLIGKMFNTILMGASGIN